MPKEALELHQLVQEKVIEKSYSRSQKPFNQFSPSQVGYCKRQMYNRKMNLTKMGRDIQGILHAGTVNHFWLEHNLPGLAEDRALQTERRFKARIETPSQYNFDLFVSGMADAVDSEGYVYDHKFTGSTYYVEDGPKQKDKRQVIMYLYGFSDVHTGRLEYVERDGSFEKDAAVYHTVNFDHDEFVDTLDNMVEVAEKVREHDRKNIEYRNPFDKCGCFYCESEEPRTEVQLKRIEDEDFNHEEVGEVE